MPHSLQNVPTSRARINGYNEGEPKVRTRKPRILLVESNDSFRHALSNIFAKRNFTISSAANLTEALEFLSQISYSLIIYDLGRPTNSGLKKLEQILSHAKDARVVVLTPFGDKAVARTVRLMGAAACLTKPVKRGTLLRAAERALR